MVHNTYFHCHLVCLSLALIDLRRNLLQERVPHLNYGWKPTPACRIRDKHLWLLRHAQFIACNLVLAHTAIFSIDAFTKSCVEVNLVPYRAYRLALNSVLTIAYREVTLSWGSVSILTDLALHLPRATSINSVFFPWAWRPGQTPPAPRSDRERWLVLNFPGAESGQTWE